MLKNIAAVTGASSGIGEAFAKKLAERGHDLILVARDKARLEALAASLRPRGVQVEVLSADLTDEAAVAAVEERLRGEEELTMLVNNAGFGTVGSFTSLPLDAELSQVRLNVMALLRLSHAATPGMVRRRRGALINVSSLAGLQPAPYTATYSATKAFVNQFTESLAGELRNSGVRVQVLCPGFTRTEFQQRAHVDASRLPSFLWMSADEVADASLRALGEGRLVCVPGLGNRAVAALTATLPRSLSSWTTAELFRLTLGAG